MQKNKLLIAVLAIGIVGYILWGGLAGVMRGVAEMERNIGGANQVVKDNQEHQIQNGKES